MADVRERSEEAPFTLQGHKYAGGLKTVAGAIVQLPPKHNNPGSPANYWLLDESIISNMQWAVTPLDPTVPVFKMPHAVIEGVVDKVINEQDGDTHLWVTLDNSKFQLACEIAPQSKDIATPAVGAHVRIYGIFRYDLQHGWPELHPVDYIEAI